jgi:hypothetical protein
MALVGRIVVTVAGASTSGIGGVPVQAALASFLPRSARFAELVVAKS